MYESDDYHRMKVRISHWESVRRYVDLARTFRSMAFGGDLMLQTDSGPHNMGEHTVTLSDSLRRDALDFLAQRCEDIAATMTEVDDPKVDIRKACNV